MAKEISRPYFPSRTLYSIFTDEIGRHYNFSTNLFEGFNSAHWANYALFLTEYATATGQYWADFPPLPADTYGVDIYEQAGGSPALSDGPPVIEGQEVWPGVTTTTTPGPVTTTTSTTTTTTTTAVPKFSASLVSRYGLIPNDLRIHAMTLTLGQGLADRFNTPDAMRFIIDAEREIEELVSDFIAVPLRPTPPRPGLIPPLMPNQPSPPTPPDFPPVDTVRSPYAPEVAITTLANKVNFPVEFVKAIIFKSIAEMLRSEFFEVEPNTSQVSIEADTRAMSYVYLFRTRPTVLVGAGRRRNPNPHMSPSIAPRGNIDLGVPGGQGV